MKSTPPANPSHLFISYAVENAALADWLARKLANEGYAVWMDRLKLLGGEPWPQDIDLAIKERTFRMLGLLSEDSIKKPNPSKERTLAMNIGKARAVPDFLIPLKLDSVDLDWMTTDLTYIPFTSGWAEGLRQLLKKLRSIDAPRMLADRPDLAASSFNVGAELVVDRSEDVVSNALLVTGIPDELSVFRIKSNVGPDGVSILDDRWAAFQVNEADVVAFGPPPPQVGADAWELRTRIAWRQVDEYANVSTATIVRVLVERVLRARLLAAGCHMHPKRKRLYYLTSPYSKDGKLHFTGRSGKTTWCKIEGRTRVLRPKKPAEEVRHLFAFDLFRWHMSELQTAIQLRPSLVFTDPSGNLITDKRVGPLRRRLTKSWWNDKWLNRLLAATHIVLNAQPIAGDGLQLDGELLRIKTERSLDESSLAGIEAEGEEVDVQELVQVDDDQAEDDE